MFECNEGTCIAAAEPLSLTPGYPRGHTRAWIDPGNGALHQATHGVYAAAHIYIERHVVQWRKHAWLHCRYSNPLNV